MSTIAAAQHPASRRAHCETTDGFPVELSVVIPTFNEMDNVDELVRRLNAALQGYAAEIIFVDDSTDATPAAITAAAGRSRIPVTLVHRDAPTGGLGGAVVTGLRAARAPWAVVMDADLQHPPSMVTTLLETGLSMRSDIVIASRYCDGGSNEGLDNAYRRAVSTASTRLAGAMLGNPVGRLSDPLSGFFAVRIAALRLDATRPIGYKVLLELIMRSGITRIAEVPYRFGARHAGESKSTVREGVRYLRHLVVLRGAVHQSRKSAERPPHPHLEVVTAPAEGRARKPLKILLVTSEAPPIVSGIARTVDRVATGLRERGHTVDVLSSVQIPRLVLGEYRFSALAAFWPSIARSLADYDVINLHGPVPTMSDVVLAMGARRGTPVVYVHHCPIAIRGIERLCNVYNRLHWMLSARSDLTLTTSEYYADQERRPGGAEVRVVSHGVDLRPRPLKARPAGAPLSVLFVGQMRGYKGVDRLIRAVAGRSEIELTLVGDGAERADFERLAADLGARNVRFLGRVTDEVLNAEYDRNEVVVLPSVTQAEAYGLVTLEGMAAGCVPVVSDLPGVRDLAEGVGLIVPPGDEDALRAALLELAADEVRLRELSKRARRKAEGRTWTHCVDQYEQALVDAAAARLGKAAPRGAAERAMAEAAVLPLFTRPRLIVADTA